MTIEKQQVKDLIKNFGKDEKDTGSVSVQVAILTTRINALTEHLKIHSKDNHSRRGLLFMVSKRRSLLDYLKSQDSQKNLNLIKKLKIRK